MRTFTTLLMLCITLPAIAFDGITTIESSFTVKETANRFEQILNEKGMTLFNRIKHSDSAKKIGIELRETELIIFGNPKAGSPLMKCQQSVAIDLPQKALIWKDAKAKVWISYNNPEYLKRRHEISGCKKVLAKIEGILSGIAKAAAKNNDTN